MSAVLRVKRWIIGRDPDPWQVVAARGLLGLVVFLTVSWLVPRLVIVKGGDSVGYDVFMRINGALEHYDYAVVTVNEAVLGDHPVDVVKQLRCRPGDELSVKQRTFYCNGFPLAVAKTHTLDGRPLTAFEWSGAIPKGYWFVATDHPDGFDSRYFGLVEAESMQRVLGVW